MMSKGKLGGLFGNRQDEEERAESGGGLEDLKAAQVDSPDAPTLLQRFASLPRRLWTAIKRVVQRGEKTE